MCKKVQLFFLISGFILFTAFKPVNNYVHKAQHEIARGNILSAKSWYLKALAIDPESYKANLGLGLMLVDYLENYSEALPYLEKAYSHAKKDTVGDMIFALGKCHQNVGHYEKALSYFHHLIGVKSFEDNNDFQKDLIKRQQDCNYGLLHLNIPRSKDLNVVNVGKTINSPMPEYVPVFTTNNDLIFTSKRKDDKKEKLNYLDGKYFESMYISKYTNGSFAPVQKYSLSNAVAHHKKVKGHESVISMSQDGQELFVFRNNKIYEIKMDERETKDPHKLFNSHFDFYENHAFLTKDGKTLYFTSEAKKGGYGGTDIYKVVKINDTEWGDPENLGPKINTEFDDEGPFLSDDGKTLFFASKGHPGYGNFDIYKSTFNNGEWTEPENLGKPINSPANDIFYVQNPDGSSGFLSSSRTGGMGDMDIYKINFLNKINTNCQEKTPLFTLKQSDKDTNDIKNVLEMKIADGFNIYKYEWKVDATATESNSTTLEYDYKTYGTHKVEAKIIAYCDTCLEPIVSCASFDNTFTKYIAPKKDSTLFTVNLKSFHGELSGEQLNIIGFKLNPIYFDFKAEHIRDDAGPILEENIKILKKNPSLVIEIHGYSDSKGTADLNKKLSLKRATIVRDYLLKHGVKKSQLKGIKGRGDDDLVNKCAKGVECDEEMHQANRRVMFHVYNK